MESNYKPSDLLAELPESFMSLTQKLTAECERIENERDELRFLLDHINSYVVPGERDSSEAGVYLLKKLMEENAAMKEVLEYYAEEGNWRYGPVHQVKDVIESSDTEPLTVMRGFYPKGMWPGGKRARAVLKKLEE